MREPDHAGSRLILFIDDDLSLLRLGRMSLERAGHRVLTASNGADGFCFARDLRPDLILLDYMMPGVSGKDVFEELRRCDDRAIRHIPVIMLTAKTNNRDEQRELLEKGLAAYLCKPFGHQELLNVIDNVMVMSRIRERNRVLEREARQSFVSTVRSLVSLLAIKDSYTGEHSNMTADLAESIALRFDLTEKQVTDIKLGALLHDIGKIGVPECILCKTTRLTLAEARVMRRHVEHGAQVLEGVPHMEAVSITVRCHHEWWDGGGYPAGLKYEEIPLSARIVAVADAYDAMTSDRPYRRRLPRATAVRRLKAAAGTQFDPLVVEKFIASLAENGDEKMRSTDLGFLEALYSAA